MTKEKDVGIPGAKTAVLTLGKYLASVRTGRDLSLRAVEEATGKVVSNAYLSQIENDRIQQPSPNILYALAELYGIDYADLMERAGYIIPTQSRAPEARHGRVATFADQNITPDEEAKLIDYLGFLRHKKG